MLVLLDRDQLEAVLARRRGWGADKLDEVWAGVPHVGQQVGCHASLQQMFRLSWHVMLAEHTLAAFADPTPVLRSHRRHASLLGRLP